VHCVGIEWKDGVGEKMRELIIHSEIDGYKKHWGGLKIFHSSSGPSETICLTLSGECVPPLLGMIISSLKSHGLFVSEAGVYYSRRDFSKLSRSKKLKERIAGKDEKKPKKTEMDMVAKV
jgi:hypothetical protein